MSYTYCVLSISWCQKACKAKDVNKVFFFFVWLKLGYSLLDFNMKIICWHVFFYTEVLSLEANHSMLFCSGKIIVVLQRYACSTPAKEWLLCGMQPGWLAQESKVTGGTSRTLFILKFSLVQIFMIQAA